MTDYQVSVRKLTDDVLMREACESTFIGKSHAQLSTIYKSEHSPARTQLFWITLKNIPLFVASHLVRHHVGVQAFQLSCREDRKGGNINFRGRIDAIRDEMANGDFSYNSIYEQLDWLKNNADRYTKVNLSMLANAQSIIDMSRRRLCRQASKETREIFSAIKHEMAKVDPDLEELMVPNCVYRGGICGEPRCCGYNHSNHFANEMLSYINLFSNKQKGYIFIGDDEYNEGE